MLTATEIMEILPHRFPMLLVDRILSVEPMKSAVGLKNVTINESFFQGHFPNHPVMPGVLLCESMAQVGGVALLYPEEHRDLIPMFTGMDKVRFRDSVRPGDTLILKAEVVKVRGQMGKVVAQALVDDKIKAEGEFMFFLYRKESEKDVKEG